MCKLLVLTNISRLKPVQLNKILKTSATIMGKTDSHGFGWVALNGSKFVGERCLEPEYFENRFFNNGTIPTMFKPIFETWEANSFGKLPQVFSGGLLVHARISTNTIHLDNTHPFVNDNHAIIHNGIVTNIGDDYNQKSTCDSEHILQHFTTGGIDAMVSGVTGYYAVGALNAVNGELTVIKDNIASLNACYVPSLDSMAFGTHADQLHQILKAAELAHTKIKAVKDNVALTFNRKGDLISQVEISPVKRANTWNAADYAASRGWSYQDDIDYNNYEDYSRTRGNVLPIHPSEKTVDSELARIRAYDDGDVYRDAPKDVPEATDTFDFVDSNGDSVPPWKLDNAFIFLDSDGNTMTAELFLALDDQEQEFCEIIERTTGEPVARRAS